MVPKHFQLSKINPEYYCLTPKQTKSVQEESLEGENYLI